MNEHEAIGIEEAWLKYSNAKQKVKADDFFRLIKFHFIDNASHESISELMSMINIKHNISYSLCNGEGYKDVLGMTKLAIQYR